MGSVKMILRSMAMGSKDSVLYLAKRMQEASTVGGILVILFVHFGWHVDDATKQMLVQSIGDFGGLLMIVLKEGAPVKREILQAQLQKVVQDLAKDVLAVSKEPKQ